MFGIVATALDADKLDYINQAIDEEMKAFIEQGPSKSELERIKTSARSRFIRGVERVSSKASLLAKSQVFAGDASFYKKSFERYQMQTQNKSLPPVKSGLAMANTIFKFYPSVNIQANQVN